MGHSIAHTWALIPARGGSKGVQRKNIHPLCGVPLITYAINAGLAAETVSRCIVSTESPEIAAIARHLGVEVDERPAALCGDAVHINDVIHEFLERMMKSPQPPELIALLQPTSPFVSPTTIDRCLRALGDHAESDSVQSVTPVTHHNHALNQRTVTDGNIAFAFPGLRRGAPRKQDKPMLYALGNFIGFRSNRFIATGSVFGNVSIVGETVDRYASIDLDTLEDFEQAEAYLTAGKIPHINLADGSPIVRDRGNPGIR